jgi:Holliday junction resolvase
MMTEQQVQTKLIKELESKGYYVIKLVKTNKNGIPDLIAIPKNSDVEFYEVKRHGGKLSKLQEYRIKELNNYGIKAITFYGPDE